MSPSEASPPTDRPTVLVVEDNLVNQRILTALLGKLGYRSDVAANGVDALTALDRHDYTAVFMDCQMPLMDGYQATERLRRRERPGRHTCVIAMTAATLAADRDRCLRAGMDDYLTKPLRSEDLAAVLAHLVPESPQPDEATEPADSTEPADPSRPGPEAEVTSRLARLREDGGEDLITELTALFLADSEVRVVALRQAVAARDAAGVIQSAHALSGASANLGATTLSRLCATLETDSESGQLVDGRAELAAVESELGRVRSVLRSWTPPR